MVLYFTFFLVLGAAPVGFIDLFYELMCLYLTLIALSRKSSYLR